MKSHRLRSVRHGAVSALVLLTLGLGGCPSDKASTSGTGGAAAAATGGSSASTGGAVATGGAESATGGDIAATGGTDAETGGIIDMTGGMALCPGLEERVTECALTSPGECTEETDAASRCFDICTISAATCEDLMHLFAGDDDESLFSEDFVGCAAACE